MANGGRFSTASWADRVAAFLLGALVLLAALWAVSSLWLPFGWDHSVFAYVADVIRRGGMPYRDVWEAKGPLVEYLYAAAQNLLGPGMWSIRVLDLAALSASSMAGYRLLHRLEGKGAALFGVAAMVLAFASFGNWYTAQADGWAAQMLVVMVAILSAPALTEVRVVGAAGMIGLLTLLKPTFGIYGLLVLAALASAKEMKHRGRAAAGAAAAFALPIGLAAAYFAARGALPALIDQHLRYNAERFAFDPDKQFSLPRALQITLGILTSYPDLAAALPGAALGIWVTFRRERRVGMLLAFWPLLTLVNIGAQRKFMLHNYSWHPLYPPIMLAAALGLGWLWREVAASLPAARVIAAVSALLIAFQVAKVPAAQTANWLRLVVGRQTLEQYRASFEGPLPWLSGLTAVDAFGFSVTRDLRLARLVRERTRPGDQIYVWANPLLNHFSDRPSLTPVTAPEVFTIWASPERRERYRAELIASVLARRAAIIAVPRMALLPGGSPEYSLRTGFPTLIAALEQAYQRTGSFEDLELYEPKPLPRDGVVGAASR